MKGKKYYFSLISLIVVGISVFNLYQQKQEERLLEFEGYGITAIEERINALYNEEKTDIIEDISEDELDELDQLLLELENKDLHKENERRIQEMHLDFLLAREMNSIQVELQSLFDDKNIVLESAKLSDFNRLSESLETFDIRPAFYKRNKEKIADGQNQLRIIKEAQELVATLLDDEGNILAGVTQDDIDEALEMIEAIKNPDIKTALAASLDGELTVVEEEEAEEDLDSDPADEEESTVTRPQQQNNNSSTSRPGNNSNTGQRPGSSSGSNGNSNGGQPSRPGNGSNNNSNDEETSGGNDNGADESGDEPSDGGNNGPGEGETPVTPPAPETPIPEPETPEQPELPVPPQPEPIPEPSENNE